MVESLLKKLGSASIRISDEVMELFLAYDWPGNVRELQNVLQQTLLLSPFGLILPEYLPERFQRRKEGKEDEGEKQALTPLEEAERDQILQCLNNVAWNQTRAAQSLGIDRKTLRVKIQRYGLIRG